MNRPEKAIGTWKGPARAGSPTSAPLKIAVVDQAGQLP
jgi:hypothetical protein